MGDISETRNDSRVTVIGEVIPSPSNYQEMIEKLQKQETSSQQELCAKYGVHPSKSLDELQSTAQTMIAKQFQRSEESRRALKDKDIRSNPQLPEVVRLKEVLAKTTEDNRFG